MIIFDREYIIEILTVDGIFHVYISTQQTGPEGAESTCATVVDADLHLS